MRAAHFGELLDVVAAEPDYQAYECALFELLDRAIGFDIAFCGRAGGIGPHAPGFDPRVRRHVSRAPEVYGREYEAMRAHLLRGRGVGVDVEFFGRSAFERMQTYRDMIQPHHGRCSLLMFTSTTVLVLGRTRADFTAREVDTLAEARALIAVCERAMATRPRTAAVAPALSPRERELVQYLRLGYTNREIAAACGTSFRTVRNQLTHLFEKLEVSTRAEMVARSFELPLALD